MEDTHIIELYFRRSETAIQETNRKYGAYCLSIAGNILKNSQDAEECVNETWLRAWQSIPPNIPQKLRLYLGKITRNLAFDCYRRMSAEKRGGTLTVLEELDECTADTVDIENEIQARQLQEVISAFLKKQPDKYRTIFLRRYFYAQPLGEIAAELGISENYAAVILGRMRKKLRQYLQKEGFGI